MNIHSNRIIFAPGGSGPSLKQFCLPASQPRARSIFTLATGGTVVTLTWKSLLLMASVLLTSTGYAGVIHDSAKSGDLEQIQRLVIDGSDVNEKGINDESPLIVASLEGQGGIVNYLLQRGAKIDARNTAGLSSLHAAAYGGHVEIVALLLAKGAQVNDAANRFGASPLHLASEENHTAVVELLLKHGADVGALEGNGYTAISRAGYREHWDVVNLLLANGAVCQEAAKVGDWLYKECSTRAAAQ